MKNLNWSKMRFICIFLAFSLVILGYFFRNHYYYQFLGLAYICIAISNICLYLFINDNLNMYINDHLRMYTSDYALI